MKPAEGTDEGIQPDFFGGQKHVVIEGKGQVRQASLEDYGKLEKMKADAKPKTTTRISEIESLLASGERISTKEHGANRDMLKMELGELRARQFASQNRTPVSIAKEMQEAEAELRKRSSAITRTMQSRAKHKSGSVLTTLAYQNAYPKLGTTSLEYYREELQDQHDMMTGKREMSSDMFEKAIRVMNARTERSQQSDMGRSAKIAPSFHVWANSPNRYDWPNVDTKITRKPKTKATKSSNPKLPRLKSVG